MPGGRRVGPGATPPAEVRARIVRLVQRTPEVMVKITGRTRDAAHLRAHLDYITRRGDLAAETPDRVALCGRSEVHELAEDWAAIALSDSRRRSGSPLSLSLVLSMPAATDAVALRDAARAFAGQTFGDTFEHVLVLHTDTAHPHVHLTILASGRNGERLNPRRQDLAAWREQFAQALRERGVAAEATARRTRGVSRRASGMALRKQMDRHINGGAPMPRARRETWRGAGHLALGVGASTPPWEAALARRQAAIRAMWIAQARLLQAGASDADRRLGHEVEAFVKAMPAPETLRLSLARRLRAAAGRAGTDADRRPPETADPGGRSRSR